MRHRNLWITGFLVIAGLLLAACGQKSAAATKVEPFKLEEISGSDFKKVILTDKAAERLGIETATVGDEQVMRTRRVGGKITASPTSATIPNTGANNEITDLSRVWVQVRLSQSDLNKIDRSKPVRVLPLNEDGEDNDNEGMEAEPDEAAGQDDGEDVGDDPDETLYYSVDNTTQSLLPGQGVFVELSLANTTAQQLVIPYAAVIYGLEGETWVYTNPEPLVFVRQPVVVDYIEGDQAYLTEGPSAGTKVVTVGGAELLGTETGVSK